MPGPSHPEPASGVEAAREIVACAERTLAAASERIELHPEFKLPQGGWPRPHGRAGIKFAGTGHVRPGELPATSTSRRLLHREQVAGLATEYIAKVGQGGKADGPGPAILQNRQIHHRDASLFCQLSQRHAALGEQLVQMTDHTMLPAPR